MSIRDLGEKIKSRAKSLRFEVLARFRYLVGLLKTENFENYYLAVVVILVGLASFGLGRLSVLEGNREPITIDQVYEGASVTNPTQVQGSGLGTRVTGTVKEVPVPSGSGNIVASKNGTKYYFTWCSGVDRISPANKIYFNSESEAKARGLQPAANCKGLGN